MAVHRKIDPVELQEAVVSIAAHAQIPLEAGALRLEMDYDTFAARLTYRTDVVMRLDRYRLHGDMNEVMVAQSIGDAVREAVAEIRKQIGAQLLVGFPPPSIAQHALMSERDAAAALQRDQLLRYERALGLLP